MEFVEQALQAISDWLDLGIFAFFAAFFKELVAWLVIAKIKIMIFTITFSWEVAKVIIFNLHLSNFIQTAWNSFDSITMGYLSFFKIPDCINVMVQAYITRLTLAVMGW